MNVTVCECVCGCMFLEGSRARDYYQPGSLGSCFLSADVAPVIQLAALLSDCRATGFVVGQLGPAEAQQRHPVEKHGTAWLKDTRQHQLQNEVGVLVLQI